MNTKLKWVIPKAVLIDAANQIMESRPGYCVDKWGEQEASECRLLCGQDYEYVETDWIRKAVITLRKSGVLNSVNGGPKRKKFQEPSGRYKEYLSTEYWKKFREDVLAFWDGKCALCAAKARDVHHNTYVRANCNEKLTDVVPLCKRCHKRFHGVMPDGNIEMEDASEDELF